MGVNSFDARNYAIERHLWQQCKHVNSLTFVVGQEENSQRSSASIDGHDGTLAHGAFKQEVESNL